MKLSAFGKVFKCEKAVKGSDFVRLYNLNGNIVASFDGILDFNGYSLTDDAGNPVEYAGNSLSDIRTARQEENKTALAAWLENHPLAWTDGKTYGVTEADQTEMALNLTQYQLAVSAGKTATLEWHAQKQACTTFTLEEYTALSLAVAAYVYPYRKYQESIKTAIYAVTTADAINAIAIDYAGVNANAETSGT